MPVIFVTADQPGAGKTAVATAIARHYAYQGIPVTLVRVAAEPSAAADADAAFFASLPFVPGSPEIPVAAADAPGGDALAVVELDAGVAPGDGAVVHVVRDAAPASAPSGATAVVVTDADGVRGVVEQALGTVPVFVVGEDRTLAGFSLDEVQAALNAERLVEGDPRPTTCDHLVIAPIGSDAAQPYFRRFQAKAVVARFDKTDMHLAAMKGEPEFLILTGGRQPSGYTFDAATATGTPVLLSRTDTENTVIALEGLFDRTRFTGERKVDRICALLEGSRLFEVLSPA